MNRLSRICSIRATTFWRELDELGYGDGRNIIIEYRYADGQAEKLPSMAAELVGIPVDLIVAIGTPASRAALAATRTIPIVMARIGDPVGYGLVASLARPGGNATAVSVFTEELAQKRLEVLRDAVPKLSRVCALYQSNFPPSEGELKQFIAAAPSLKVQVQTVGIRSRSAMEGALSEIMAGSPQALFVVSSLLFELIIPWQTVNLVLKSGLPALYVRRGFLRSAASCHMASPTARCAARRRITSSRFSEARERQTFPCSCR